MPDTELAMQTTLSRTGVAFARVAEWEGLEITTETEEDTTLAPVGNYREIEAASHLVSDLALKGFFCSSEAGLAELGSDADTGTLQSFTLTMTAAAMTVTQSFLAIVTGFRIIGTMSNGELGFIATLSPSGKVTVAVQKQHVD